MKPNILLIVMDSVRAKNTSFHGHHNVTTPFLQEFAENSVTYKQARAPGNWSLPSHVSMFTGKDIYEHQITRSSDKLQPGNTIFEDLNGQGYQTSLFSSNAWLAQMDVGLREVFEEIYGPTNLYPFQNALSPDQLMLDPGFQGNLQYLTEALKSDRKLKSLANGASKKISHDYPGLLPDSLKSTTSANTFTDLFLDWQENIDQPWATCINFMDSHLPYQPSNEYNLWGDEIVEGLQEKSKDHKWQFYSGKRPWWQLKAFESLYDGAILQIDQQIQRIVDNLKKRGDLEDTLIIVTSDHGECFGEWSTIREMRLAAHGVGMHESLLHVPLIVNPPQEFASEINSLATLSNIPKMIRQTVLEQFSPDSLIEGEVVSYIDGLVEPDQEHAQHYCEDPDVFSGEQWVKYTKQANGYVTKESVWNSEKRNNSIQSQIPDSQNEIFIGSSETNWTDEFQLGSANIKTGGTDVYDASDDVQDRLEDLGYM